MLSILPLLSVLVPLVVCTLATQCPTYDYVVSGVFQPNNEPSNYSSTEGVCACFNATVASLENVNLALNKTYETCTWGWVKEQKVVMPRFTASARCANSSIGLQPKMPCVYIAAENAFCFNTKVVKGVFQIYDQNNKTNLTVQERFDLCGTINATVANLDQLENANKAGYAPCSAGWRADWTVYNVSNTNCSNETTTNSTGTNSVFCSREEPKEVIQLFAQDNRTLTKEEGIELCKTQNAAVASLAEVKDSNRSGFTACSAGWVADWKLYSFASSFNNTSCPSNSTKNSTGSISRPVFCFREELMDSGLYKISTPIGSQLLNKTEAKNLCVSLRDNLATVAQMKNSSSALLKAGLSGWCQEGIVKTGVNGTVDLLPCVNYPDVLAGVYCYNPALADTASKDTFWKKIVMGCILASIFIILLIAALFMRGNQFICCLEKTHPVNVDGLNEVRRFSGQVPVWNTTGTYKPVSEMVDPVYSNRPFLPQPGMPALRPEMSTYRTHMLSERPPSEVPAMLPEGRYKDGRFYDNLGYVNTEE